MKKQTKLTSSQIRRLCAISLFAAMAYVAVLLFRIKVQFLTFDIKDVFLGICALVYGPLAGAVCAVTVALIEMITVSDTMFYGFIMNTLSSCAFVCPAAIIYNTKRNLKRAGIGVGVSVVFMTVVMLLANVIVTPLYQGMPVSAILPLLPTLILPFNFTKALANGALIFFLYDPITRAMKRVGLIQKSKNQELPPVDSAQNSREASSAQSRRKTTFSVLLLSLLVLSLALACFFVLLEGKIILFR